MDNIATPNSHYDANCSWLVSCVRSSASEECERDKRGQGQMSSTPWNSFSLGLKDFEVGVVVRDVRAVHRVEDRLNSVVAGT